MSSEEVLDVLIVGAGFAGLYCLNKFRNENFKTKLFEAGGDIGGTWYWNCYPGARVDSDFPVYQFANEKLWKDFNWTERFPGYKEIRRYLHHVDEKFQLKKDISFNTRVESAVFDGDRNHWSIQANGRDGSSTVCAKHLILCTGFASKKYVPNIDGMEKFKGVLQHTSTWPQDDGIKLDGKRVAVIGTGATAVQVIQEIGPIVSHLTVYQRTPNLALPMQQYKREEPNERFTFPLVSDFRKIFENCRNNFSGLNMKNVDIGALEHTPEQRHKFYEELFETGGFTFWLATYKDVLFDQAANDTAYAYWCEKTRARITDEKKKDILAPKLAPHSFGTKRPCLEQRYFEVFNQDNVDIINLKTSPILGITEEGVETKNEGVIPVDVIILATGFDSVTGSITNINIMNEDGRTLKEKWLEEGTKTCLGVATAGFPNMFFLYGPGAPTAFSNGPTTIEIQGEWIVKLITKMREQKLNKIVPTKELEGSWSEVVDNVWNSSLFLHTDSWYQAANIPGRRREPLYFLGGIPAYIDALKDCESKDYEGFLLL